MHGASPEGATLLASNSHSHVQAAIIPLGNSTVWGVQYHPEYDLQQLAQLYTLYAEDMVSQGFFADTAELQRYSDKLMELNKNPDHAGLAWQLGIDGDILDPSRRRAEIIAWVKACVLGQS
jgi:GMP synthase (glutamine-hydrolysing)